MYLGSYLYCQAYHSYRKTTRIMGYPSFLPGNYCCLRHSGFSFGLVVQAQAFAKVIYPGFCMKDFDKRAWLFQEFCYGCSHVYEFELAPDCVNAKPCCHSPGFALGF